MGWLKKQVKKVSKALKKTSTIVGAAVGVMTGIGVVAGIAGSLLLNKSSSSSNTNTGTTTAINNDTNIYIPAIVISFEGHLFKPNTRLYTFFDGRDVSQYIKPDGGSLGDPLITSASGYIKGEFHLPNNSSMRFTQGRKDLKFTDSQKNDGNETTYAYSTFTYSGSEDNTSAQDIGGTQSTESKADPLVQSFMVLDKGGIYLKAIDLYFISKDNIDPVLFQIREVNDDTVSDWYLTNSNFILNPSDINISNDGSVATTVNLYSPVYLQEGKEYAIYMVTNAPATYTLATCVYGDTNSYNQLSTKDPRIGGIMKNLGASAWLKDTTKGIKFVLYKCAFDTTQKYTLALDNESLNPHLLGTNCLSTTINTNIITVKDPEHGFNVGDYVTISGLPDDTVYGGINSDYINGIHKIIEVTNDTYSFDSIMSGGSETPIPTDATSSVIFGVNVSTDTSYQYDTLLLNNNEILLSNTKLEYEFKSLSGRSLDGSETPNIFDTTFSEITNKVEYNTSKVKKINSSYNEANLNPGGDKSLQVNIAFSTNNENISPVIDLTNTNAVLVENVINNRDENEIEDTELAGIARYITKDVSLSTQSNGVQVRFSANIQGNANVKVYYKTLPITSTGSLADESWVEMNLDRDVSKASNDSTYNDYVYTTYNIPLFKAFKTKVLMISNDSTKPPLIKEYRAIAFQSIDNE